MVHRADVLKDRTWALNGRTFRWMDKAKYEAGGYRQVWESIRAHFEEVQATMQPVIILAGPVLPPAPAQGSDFGRPLVGVQDAQRTFQLFELELVTAAFWTSPTR